MKNIFIPFLILLIITSCSKEENEEEIAETVFSIEDIVGSWAYDTVAIYFHHFAYRQASPHQLQSENQGLDFKFN